MGGKLNNLIKLKSVHPEARKRFQSLIDYANLMGYSVVITSGFRTFEESKKLHAENAKNALLSFHNMGCAIDINLISDHTGKKLMKSSTTDEWNYTGVPQFAKSIGLRWGGDYNSYHDPIHFEYSKKAITDINSQGLKQGIKNEKWDLSIITV
jgi:hypothetical protein